MGFLKRIRLKKYQDLSPYEVIQVAHWRNSYAIRKCMIERDIFSLKAHKHFIKFLDFPFVKVEDLGAFNFQFVDNDSVELGIFKNPFKKRVGTFLMEQALLYAKKHFPEKKIILKVFKHNRRAIKLYKRFDFKVIKQEKRLLFMERVCANR